MWVGGAMAVAGAVSGIMDAKAANAEKRRAVRIQRNNAVMSYTGVMHSVNLMKENSRESAINAVSEVLRAGGEDARNAKRNIRGAQGKLQSRSEGLTSGRSAGRQMTALHNKGSKMLNKLQGNRDNMISKITDQMDSNTNTLNNKQIESYDNMVTVLSQEHPAAANPMMAAAGGALKGYQIGSSLSTSAKKIDLFSGADTGLTTSVDYSGMEFKGVEVDNSGVAGGVNI